MARPKPRISRSDSPDGWQVTLPAFGFRRDPEVKSGFRSREAACRWLRGISIGASDGTMVQFAGPPRRDWWGDTNWLVVIR